MIGSISTAANVSRIRRFRRRRVWSAATGAPLITYRDTVKGHWGGGVKAAIHYVYAVAFDHAGERLATACRAGRRRVEPLQLHFNMTLYESMRAIYVSRSRELVQR